MLDMTLNEILCSTCGQIQREILFYFFPDFNLLVHAVQLFLKTRMDAFKGFGNIHVMISINLTVIEQNLQKITKEVSSLQ